MNYRRPIVEVQADRWPRAVQPATGVDWRPQAGYRRDQFRDPTGIDIPALVISVPARRLVETFLALLEPLGSVVNLVLESSHAAGPSVSRTRDRIDGAVLASLAWEYEDLLVNDGCTSLAVVARGCPIEVQLDDHKGLFVYTYKRRAFRDILRASGLRRRQNMLMAFEVPHMHRSSPEYTAQFREFADACAADGPRPNYVG